MFEAIYNLLTPQLDAADPGRAAFATDQEQCDHQYIERVRILTEAHEAIDRIAQNYGFALA
jgi:hypothetical protein